VLRLEEELLAFSGSSLGSESCERRREGVEAVLEELSFGLGEVGLVVLVLAVVNAGVLVSFGELECGIGEDGEELGLGLEVEVGAHSTSVGLQGGQFEPPYPLFSLPGRNRRSQWLSGP